MKKLILVLTCAFAMFVIAEESTKPVDQNDAKARAERVRRRTGGFVIDRRGAKGIFVFFNAQKSVEENVIALQASQLERDCLIAINVSKLEDAKINEVDSHMKIAKAKAAAFLVECDCPASIVVAPEQKFAFININALKKDNPDVDTLSFRVRKEMSRAMAMIFGAGYTFQGGGAMAPAFSLLDVDSLPIGAFPMETSNAITVNASKMGFVPFKRSLYSKALREGWAPEPKGEIQKALWEEYHAKPTEPMRVEFDKSKGE